MQPFDTQEEKLARPTGLEPVTLGSEVFWEAA